MNRREFIRNSAVMLGALGTLGITGGLVSAAVDPTPDDLWECLDMLGFRWKLRHPWLRCRDGLPLGEWFLSHPLLGRVRDIEWDTPGENAIPQACTGIWKSDEWFYANVAQLQHRSYNSSRKTEWVLYWPYGKFNSQGWPLNCQFNTSVEFRREWNQVRRLLRSIT